MTEESEITNPSEGPDSKSAGATEGAKPKEAKAKGDAGAAKVDKAAEAKAAKAAKAAAEKKPAKPAAAATKKPAKGGEDRTQVMRRDFVWWSTAAFIAASLAATVKFFFPRVLFEPATKFPIGFPSDYSLGVDTKWQQAKRIWVVKEPTKLYVIFARCTHLGCTPDWKEAENKFKCPCHGSGFDSQGVNFEGPAPQPLLRTAVALDARGQIQVDMGRLFPVDAWDSSDAFLVV